MRKLPLVAFVLAALALAPAAASRTLFVLEGSGWGHGVGMSQWGAQGKALRGVGYRDILGFYYEGTTLGAGGQSVVRVLLTENRRSVTLSSAARFTVGSRTLAANTAYTVVPAADGNVRIVDVGKFADGVFARPGTAALRLDGLRYRGSLRFWVHGGRVDVVNHVKLEHYLFAVVPREMPASFEAEALKAQAVAARSYAVRVQKATWFDVYDDTRDQVYGGLDSGGGEDPATTAAVQATAGEVVHYGTDVAQTFFSSSNGGFEAASVDTWGGDLPYLQAKKDPDDLTPGNPNRSWVARRTASQFRRGLGLSRTPTDAVVSARASGRLKTVTASAPGWSQAVTGKAELFRSGLGLKSSRLSIGVLSIRPGDGRIVCRQRVRLDIVARGLGNVTLQRRAVNRTTWETMGMSDLGGGDFVARPRLCASTFFRLHSSAATGATTKVRVAAAINFALDQPRSGGLRGVVKPASLLAGRTVTVDRRRSDGSWRPRATATVRTDGTWLARFDVTAGVYRARVKPPSGSGLLAGVSPTLTVRTG